MSHCRCEAFNSTLRAHNVYFNRLAPSKDIATSFSVMEQLRLIIFVEDEVYLMVILLGVCFAILQYHNHDYHDS